MHVINNTQSFNAKNYVTPTNQTAKQNIISLASSYNKIFSYNFGKSLGLAFKTEWNIKFRLQWWSVNMVKMLSGLRYNTKENYKPWSKHAKLTNWVSA